MAYFHCLIGGGSSGGGYELTVTCDADFAGTTITCTDGVTTLTQTCPSASPYEVVFELPNGGDWTVSGTISGDVYSTSINIPSSLELHYISTPEGSTVLPTDDIQIWLACANITDKSYTTLAEVLADKETFETLLADSNACDYMARSTTWALSEGLVPTMTGYTTPSGAAYANSEFRSPYLAWKAFNGVLGTTNDGNRWVSAQGQYGTNAYLAYDFGEPTTTDKAKVYVVISGSSENPQASVIHIEGSNDNNTWMPITTKSMSVTDMTQYTEIPYNSVTYRYYRAYFESCVIKGTGSDYYSQLRVLQFYKADITTNQDAMALIGKYDYCSYVLRNDSTWNTAINASSYASYIPLNPSGTITNTNGIIHTANGDTVYYINGQGQQVSIDASDFDFSSLDEGVYTFGSTTAKNPNDLSQDYTKQFKITKSPYGGTTELYLMPDTVKTLYWWGYENNIEDVTSANGWTYSGSIGGTITHNTTNITLNNTANSVTGIGSKNAVDMTTLGFKTIAKGVRGVSNNYGVLDTFSSKSLNARVGTVVNITTNTMTTLEHISPNQSAYVSVYLNGNKNLEIYALWLE